MTEKKKVTLVCQDPSKNSDKYYLMYPSKDGRFIVEYGAMGTTPRVHEYDAKEWNRLYNSKIRKGYIDVSGEITAGSPIVVKPYNRLMVVSEVFYHHNEPCSLSAYDEQGEFHHIDADNASMGYLNPGSFTHEAFYPNLLKRYKAYNER